MTGLPTAEAAQREVIEFLSRPASYGIAAGGVERVETHCSIVFLVAGRAYKLKRAIRYASLDYTTLRQRRTACEAELMLNRRTAPELYLGVRSINRDAAGALAFDGPGPALDHVVVMRRFDQADLFDHMVEQGSLTPPMMAALGEAVARFHQAAEVTPAFGGSDAIDRVIAENARELARVAAALDGAAVGALTSRALAARDALAPLLDRRRAEGKVRRCHGDLRLANICLHGGRPTLFDCIDFSDEIGCIDVLHDLAFLLMDLLVRGHGDLANAVFNAYLDVAPEDAGLRCLPLFLALRAATRSFALAGGAGRETDALRAAAKLTSARRHIEAGIGFLAPAPPLLVAVAGERREALAGALASVAQPPPGARLLHLGGCGPAARRDAIAVLQAGCSVLIEGAFIDAPERTAVAALAARAGVQFVGCWLGAPPAGLDGGLWRVLRPDEATPMSLATLLSAERQESVAVTD